MNIPEIYKLAQRYDQQWGIPGYEAPPKYFDHIRHAEETTNFKYVNNELKRPKPGSVNPNTKRANFLDEVEKREKYKPEPWKYDLRKKWITGFQSTHLKENVSQSRQKLKFQWLELPTEKQEIEKWERSKSGKLDMNAKKYTFIDQIIIQNSKPEYPKPGPGNYFLDVKGIKKLYPEHEDLVTKKETDDKIIKDKLP